MKKFFAFLAVAGALAFTANFAFAQDHAAAPQEETVAADSTAAEAPATSEDILAGNQDVPLHQALKTKFIEGGAGFMSLVIICLILGLALSIERILYLAFSKTNTQKLLQKVEDALAEGGIEKAKEVCRDTRGPVASIFYQGCFAPTRA